MAEYYNGVNYVWSYSGVLKLTEAVLNISLIIFTALLGASFQTNFLFGLTVYGLISVIILLIFHIRGISKDSEFPWFWVEFINCTILIVLLAISSSLLIILLTKGCILTGIIGYIAVLVYSLDAIEKFQIARTPRSRYVWTTPNMPELS